MAFAIGDEELDQGLRLYLHRQSFARNVGLDA